MAFTLSHPALVLPLDKIDNNKGFNLSALILGSMAPDFQDFIPIIPNESIANYLYYNEGHSIKGIFALDLPSIIFIGLVLRYILRLPLILNMPNNISNNIYYRYINKPKESWIKFCFKFITSALIGIISHILWDNFTHPSGIFVRMISILRAQLFNIPVYNILQLLTSILGLIYIVYYVVYTNYTSHNEVPYIKETKKIIYWIGIIITAILYTVHKTFGMNISIHDQYRTYIVDFIIGGIIGTLIMSLIYTYILNYRKFDVSI